MSHNSEVATMQPADRPPAPAWLGFLSLACGVFCAALLGMELTRLSGRIASLWPANGVVLVVLLHWPRRGWPGWLAAGLVGTLLANLVNGDPAPQALALGLCNTFEIALAGWLVCAGSTPTAVDLTRPSWLLRFMILGGLLAPAAAALPAASLVHVWTGAAWPLLYRTWFAADALGMLITVPLLAGTTRASVQWALTGSRRRELAIIAILAVGCTAGLHRAGRIDWVFLLCPVVIGAALRLGYGGAALAIFLVGLTGLVEIAREAGSVVPAVAIREQIVYWQEFVLVNILTALPVAALFQQAEDSERRYRHLFAGLPLPAWVSDELDGHFLAVNDTAVRVYGYSHEEFLTLKVRDLWPAADREQYDRLLAESRGQSIHGEWRHCKRDGTQIDVAVTADLLPVEFGQRRCRLSIVHDVTARNRAAAEYEALQAQLAQAQKMESIGRLAGGVAHDFNNMLMVILGHAELALADGSDPQLLREDVETILGAARRSADLTSQLLAFARRQTAQPQVVHLDQQLDGLLTMLRRLLGEQLDLTWTAPANLWAVRVDPAQIDAVLTNLTLNARDAIETTGTISIEVANLVLTDEKWLGAAEALPGEYVTVTVTDDGSGMAPEVAAQAFEPFFTTKPPGAGSGLGLAMVYGIVKQNGGWITLDSCLGRGTTVRLGLPRCADQPEPPRSGLPKGPEGHETVLLVEDEPQVLALTCRLLETLGYCVLAASRPSEALALAQQHREVDVLLTDVIMPEMTGPELYQRLLADLGSLRCLFMSGYSEEAIAQQGILAESISLLPKPFTAEALDHRLRAVVNA